MSALASQPGTAPSMNTTGPRSSTYRATHSRPKEGTRRRRLNHENTAISAPSLWGRGSGRGCGVWSSVVLGVVVGVDGGGEEGVDGVPEVDVEFWVRVGVP